MVSMGKEIPKAAAHVLVLESLNKGLAYQKFLEFVKVQNGDVDRIRVSDKKKKIKSKCDGVIKRIDALELGKLSVSLGAGRRTKEDKIDHGVGIKLHKHIGDVVKIMETRPLSATKKFRLIEIVEKKVSL
jgi:pyrimidine-nucleoside phosphorylase